MTNYTSIEEPPEWPSAERTVLMRRKKILSVVTATLMALALIFTICVAVASLRPSEKGEQLAKSSKSSKSGKSGKTKVAKAVDSCSAKDFSKKTLKLAFESPMTAMYLYLGGERKHEMSDVMFQNNKFYAVGDSSWSLFEMDRSLPYFSETNRIIDPAEVPYPDEESSYEAIFYDQGTIYMVRESLASTTAKGATEYHAAVVEAQLQETPVMQGALTGAGGGDSGGRASYTVTMECPVEELFEGDSKGFEGAIHLHDATGQLYMLALCEGNHCAQKQKGREKGNGVLVVTKKVVKDDGTCSWQTIRHMKVPSSAMFQDYSGINIQQGTGRVLISSQEESQLWVGRMSLCSDGRFDPMKSELEGGVVFDFPRNDACEIIYCNLEGVTWVTDHLIVAVSDRMKGGGAQPSRCQAKDQSIHVFALPESWEKSLQATLP